MKLSAPIWDVGFELEYFLTRGNLLLNASKEVENALGFSIDQNDTRAGRLVLGEGYELRTDGTCMELQCFQPYNYGMVPKIDWERLNKVKLGIDCTRNLSCFHKEGDHSICYGVATKFDNPGNVFSSGKWLHNAYTNEGLYATKKNGVDEDPKFVTMRTAGFHLHLSLCERAVGWSGDKIKKFNDEIVNHKAANGLIKILDGIYDHVFVNNHSFTVTKTIERREKEYQKRGDYRIKLGRENKSGNPSIEYRQLSSEHASQSRVQAFVDIFQRESAAYIKDIL